MKVTFLGTGAATSYPLPFCRCKNCEQARAIGGPSLRKRSSLLINNGLLIDMGPDIMASSFDYNCNISNVRYCLLTHAHSDHLDISHLLTRPAWMAAVDVPHLDFYASAASLKKAAELSRNEDFNAQLLDPQYCTNQLNLEIHEVEPFKVFDAGGYRVTAFPAKHDSSVQPLVFAIQSREQAVFYGTDTATLPEETWQGFHQNELKFDVFILDHTYGPGFAADDHMDALQFVEHVARLRKEGLLTEHARIFATHISHEGNPVHQELVSFAAQHGYEIAYDGLTI
jgi:phosphoribosyl 1,2-cyclic phosphate phosphodiesterase